MSSQKLKRTTSRGFVNNIILESLLDGDKYGYEIIKEIEEKSDGKIILKQPSLYSSLKRFEAKGVITSYWGDSDIGGRRHYYTITEMGKKYHQSILNGEKFEFPIDEDSDDNNTQQSISIDAIIESDNSSIKASKNISTKNEDQDKEVEKNTKQLPTNIIDTDSEDYDIFNVISNESKKSDESEVDAFKNDNITSDTDNTNDDITTTTLESSSKLESENSVKEETNAEEEVNTNDTLIKTDNIKETIESTTLLEDTTENIVISIEDEIVSEIEVTQVEENTHTTNSIQDSLFDNINESNITEEEVVDINEINNTKNSNENISETETSEVIKTETKEIPLIKESDHEYFNWEEIKRNAVSKNKEEIVVKKNISIVDEYGITRNADDILPKREEKTFDNVGYRLSTEDPLDKNKKQTKTVEKTSTTTQLTTQETKPFEERERSIEEKIEKHKKVKPTKEDIDFKDLLGDIYIEDDNNFNNSVVYEDNKNEFVESSDLSYKNKSIKITSYTALEDNLKSDGFKYKAYNPNLLTDTEKYEFIYTNKAKLYLSLIMMILSVLQLSAFMVAINKISYVIKDIDKSVITLLYALPVSIFLYLLFKFVFNMKKRKKVSFNFPQNFIYSILAFLSLCIITYAVNSFFGLHLQNITPYYITLFMPAILFFNIILTPIVYVIILNNKKFY